MVGGWFPLTVWEPPVSLHVWNMRRGEVAQCGMRATHVGIK